MNFYEVKFPPTETPLNVVFPCALLSIDNWDDFTYSTTWGIHVYREADVKILESVIKILQRDPKYPTKALRSTTIPANFTELGTDYCSLGQDLEYYEKLKAAGPDIYEPFFKAVRDAAIYPEIAAEFEQMAGFQKSLLRFSAAHKAFSEARSLLTGRKFMSAYRFDFQCVVPGAQAPHVVSFDFSHHPTSLHRMSVIVGKNGTGKTQFLAEFARALSGLNDSNDPEHGFTPKRPNFDRVIAVSYSVFDDFTRPPEDSRTFSYKYCGIRTPDGPTGEGAKFLSREQLKQRLQKARDSIVAQNRESRWKEILEILLECKFSETDAEFASIAFYDHLSSGQRILVSIITEIVAHIVPQSIILFDEPELHLHPEVLSSLTRALDLLLSEFDSYAIIASHSALLLQEILSRQVRIFRRDGNMPIVEELTIESFGENLTSITGEVFAMDREEHNFRAHLDKLSREFPAERIEALFPRGLPLQAQAYLRAIAPDRFR